MRFVRGSAAACWQVPAMQPPPCIHPISPQKHVQSHAAELLTALLLALACHLPGLHVKLMNSLGSQCLDAAHAPAAHAVPARARGRHPPSRARVGARAQLQRRGAGQSRRRGCRCQHLIGQLLDQPPVAHAGQQLRGARGGLMAWVWGRAGMLRQISFW